jgi:hypothetical protein
MARSAEGRGNLPERVAVLVAASCAIRQFGISGFGKGGNLVIPAKAAIQLLRSARNWIPAFAGMTVVLVAYGIRPMPAR